MRPKPPELSGLSTNFSVEKDRRYDALPSLLQTFNDLKVQPEACGKLMEAVASLKYKLGELPDALSLFDLTNADYRA